MEAIREIISADMLLPIINLPWKSKDLPVEVIVIPQFKRAVSRAKS